RDTSPPGQVAAMKQAQWIGAVLALAVLVFIVTFAMQWLGSDTGSREGKPPPPSDAQLEFYARSAPLPGPGGGLPFIECEVRQTSSHDYWFDNPSDKPVTLGLQRKTCACSGVQAFVLPESGKARLVEAAAGLRGLVAAGPLHAATYLVAGLDAAQRDAQSQEL